MNVVSLTKGTDVLNNVPKAPVYLTDAAKKHWITMGKILAKNNLLKEKFLSALEVYAEAMAQWEFAIREIRRKNAASMGTGYIQTYNSGAKNVSVEVTLKNDAESTLFKCFKVFGLEPKSEKELKAVGDPNQGSLFDQMMKLKNGTE